jgi:hypothetical protein
MVLFVTAIDEGIFLEAVTMKIANHFDLVVAMYI